MNIDQLQKVGEIISGLGANTKEGFVYYLGYSLISDLISAGISIFAIYCIFCIGKALFNYSVCINAIKELCQEYNIDFYNYAGDLKKSNIEKLIKEIKKSKNSN
jgi:hypothetical protein